MNKTLLAYTAPGIEYPQFINVRYADDPSYVIFGVRGSAEQRNHENGAYLGEGSLVEITVPVDAISEQLQGLAFAALSAKVDHPSAVPGERRTAEHVEAIGDISVTRRLIVESIDGEPLHIQVARLASTILELYDTEPSQDEGAVDSAIRLLRAYARLHRDLVFAFERLPGLKSHGPQGLSKIAAGLRAGLAEEPQPGETVDHAITVENDPRVVGEAHETEENDGDEQTALEQAAPVAAAAVEDQRQNADVVAQPEVHEDFVPAGGRDPGDESEVRA